MVATESSGWERATWAEHYGPLAGWLLVTTGDRSTAYRFADKAFVQLFSHRPVSPDRARRRLYRDALASLDQWFGYQNASPASLATAVAGLPKETRQCVLLDYAGLDVADIARILRLRSEDVVRRLLAVAAEHPQPNADVISLPEQREADAVTPGQGDERVGSAN